MIELRAKLWRGVGLAAVLAGGVGLAACQPGGEAGENGAAQHGEAGEAAKGETGGEAGEGAAPAPVEAAAGGEAGEAGASTAYASLAPAAEAALRLQHLKGFLLVAQKELQAGRAAEAGALVGQGVLEVHTPAPQAFSGLDIAPLTAASNALMDGKPEGAAALQRAIDAVSSKQAPADAALVLRMLTITRGLYAGVVSSGVVDAVEYQHSLGAALAAQDAFTRAEAALTAKNAARTAEAKAELERLVALWPSPTAPLAPTPPAKVAAQTSRVELALYGL
ncbi:MAG: hypothetical protein JNM47_03400 [Hyphomonadaceae bacterium]|nr:hypothetical protein [Hyphomonadaceae bacterium]